MKEITETVYRGHVNLIENRKELQKFFATIEDGSLLTFDWETTGLEYNAQPLLLSMHQRGKSATVVPLTEFFSVGVSKEELAEECNKNFKRVRLMAHNAKYDSMINVMNGILDENCNIEIDTLVMIHLVNPDLDKQLEKRVELDFGYKKPTFKEVCGKKWEQIDWYKEGDELLEMLAGYAGEDTYWTTKMYEKYKELMDADLWAILRKIEMPMIKILRDAKIRGVLIDVSLLRDMGKRAQAACEDAIDKIYEEAGCVFNLNSPKQKQKVFFEQLKLPIISYTKSGQPATDSNSAKEWADMGYPIGEALVKYSELQKLLSGYIDSIPELVDEHNVLRGDLNSCGTRTGRFSSSNPNLQNQPNNHDFPIRDAFIPRPGYVFVNYDYSQLELRVMAHMSKDAKFIDIFNSGRDPHGEVARDLGITRKRAKVCNFGVLYGMGIPKFATSFDVTEEEAKSIIDNYHTTYEGFARWKHATEEYAKKHGEVRNLFGRRRLLAEAAKNPYSGHVDKKKFFAELRQSVNCVDTETQIFTKRGWLTYEEVKVGDIALTYNGDKDIMEWQPIMEVVRMPYKGKMLSMEGEAHSSLSTPNHRWFVRDAMSGPCVTRDSAFIEQMSNKGSYRIPINAKGEWEGSKEFTDDWLELFGVFLTDGHQECLHQIEICQSTSPRKNGNVEYIEKLIRRVGCEITRKREHSWGDYCPCVYWSIKGSFVEWCKKVCDDTKRVVDKSWLYSLSQRQAQKLMNGILLGDGYNSSKSKTKYIGNIRKSMIDFFAEVALMAGYSYGISKPSKNSKNRDYVLSLKSRNNIYCGVLRREYVDYDGIVWCPRVENQSFVMKRNDKVCITRNTIIQGTGADIVKRATVAMCNEFEKRNLDAHFLLQVHDEVLIEARIDQMFEIERVIIDCMENTTELCIPLEVDGKIITKWGDMKDDNILSLPFRFDYSLYSGIL